MNTEKLATETDETLAELLQLVDSFSNEEINEIPFDGSWTAGQLAQHLIMSGSGFLQMINGPVKDTDKRPDEKVEQIKTIFLDFNSKMKSPDFIVPPDKSYIKEELVNELKNIQHGLATAIKTLDLSKTCTARELPFLGLLTRLEAASFVLYHTQRHVHQLKNIQLSLHQHAGKVQQLA